MHVFGYKAVIIFMRKWHLYLLILRCPCFSFFLHRNEEMVGRSSFPMQFFPIANAALPQEYFFVQKMVGVKYVCFSIQFRNIGTKAPFLTIGVEIWTRHQHRLCPSTCTERVMRNPVYKTSVTGPCSTVSGRSNLVIPKYHIPQKMTTARDVLSHKNFLSVRNIRMCRHQSHLIIFV